MKQISVTFILLAVWVSLFFPASGQPETVFPKKSLLDLANTVSGSRPYQILLDLTAYNRDRPPQEYAETWRESEIVAGEARKHGFADVEILRYPRDPIWDGMAGQLWILEPDLRKLLDFQDIPTVLAPGSVTGVYEGQLVWIEDAANPDALSSRDLSGKIVLTASETGRAFTNAISRGAIGVVNMNSPRPHTAPDAILWSEVGQPDRGFAFNISARMLEDLQKILDSGPVTLRAIVEAEWRDVDNEVVTAVIPGDGSTDEWVYLTAHLFEGIQKQGSSDNASGAVVLLEAGRTLAHLLSEGSLHRTARNLRFLWIDEFRGTFDFIGSHPQEFGRLTANINLDMAGQNLELNKSALRLYRMPDSRIHFIADVAEELLEWVGTTNIENVHEREGGYGFSFPLTDPYGTRDPFRYRIEAFYGSSDHQVFTDRGVPSVLLNNWPDMVYHSSHDRPNLMDPTQMKRAAFIAAASALVAAGSPETDPIQVASVAFGRGRRRLADDLRQWTHGMFSVPQEDRPRFYRDLAFAQPHWYEREIRNLESVMSLAVGSARAHAETLRQTVLRMRNQLELQANAEKELLKQLYLAAAGSKGESRPPVDLNLTEEELQARRVVPSIKEVPRWSRGRGLPGFTAMEARNYVDGVRSAWEIRNAVNSEYLLEYGPISPMAVVNYLKNLERSGIISIREE